VGVSLDIGLFFLPQFTVVIRNGWRGVKDHEITRRAGRAQDVGCGSGINSAALAAKGHRLHGVDLSEAGIEKYRRRGFDGRVCDIESGLDYPDASFDLWRDIMIPISTMRVMLLAVLGLLAVGTANAQTENLSMPAGSTTWHYECKPGANCPTKCAAGGTELFSTGNYTSLTIVQLPGRSYWFRVDTGHGKVDYITQADQVNCSIIGATLSSARAQKSEK
jgi:SAM-dependent methyltransferase